MIPSLADREMDLVAVYQRGLVIDSQLFGALVQNKVSISKGIGD